MSLLPALFRWPDILCIHLLSLPYQTLPRIGSFDCRPFQELQTERVEDLDVILTNATSADTLLLPCLFRTAGMCSQDSVFDHWHVNKDIQIQWEEGFVLPFFGWNSARFKNCYI